MAAIGANDRSLSTSSLHATTRPTLTASDINLLGILLSNASWIWFPEDATTLPVAPSNEQRAFRKSYAYPKDKGTPKNATIFVAADDYYAMYVDGVLAHEADPKHTWDTIEAFNIPLPVATTRGQADLPGSDMLLGFRVVNNENTAGLLAAIQVNFDSGQSDIFYTGLDQTWLSERLVQEHWEQPWFEATPQGRKWSPATVFTKLQRDASVEGLSMQSREVTVLGQLTLESVSSVESSSTSAGSAARGSETAAPTPSPGANGEGSCGSEVGGIRMSVGVFAGTIAGSVVLSLVLGALLAILVMKRTRSQSREPASSLYIAKRAEYPDFATETTPGRPLYGSQFSH